MWSLKHDKCVVCGTTSHRHLGRGLCELCYQKDIEKRGRYFERKNEKASEILTKDFLVTEYQQNHKSLSDIGAYAACSRQYVYKKILEYGICLRSKTESRTIALEKGKVGFERIDEHGIVKKIILQKNKLNDKFFKAWSDPMAYVLGVIFTDGNLRAGALRDPISSDTLRVGRLTISQKEPELLQKVLALMECDAKLLLRKRGTYNSVVSGQLHYFHINNDGLYDDLIALGLSPKKSLKIQFPDVPTQYVRHFIRGCWDGDGSVYFDGQSGKIRASYICGSLLFISQIVQELYKIGIPRRTIHTKQGKSASYYIRVDGIYLKKLFHFLYDEVPSSQYLQRKYDIFKLCDVQKR